MGRALIATAFLLLAACAAAPAPSTRPFALAGASWLRVDDDNANPHGATLAFAATRASGYTGCNRWFADLRQSDRALRFSALAMTRMACQTEMQAATERNFVAALERTRFYHLEGEELVFTDANNAVVARFTCSAEPCPRAN